MIGCRGTLESRYLVILRIVAYLESDTMWSVITSLTQRNYNFDELVKMIMLKITTIAGNIFDDEKFHSLRDGNFERFKVSRMELEKNRIRRTTDLGTDVGLLLDAGMTLHHGDVLGSNNNGRFIVVEQMPEKVITVRLKKIKTESIDHLVLLGHILGNRHRPISIEDNTIVSFPIQADSELEVFQKLFVEIIDNVELSMEEKIFKPHTKGGANVNDHNR